MRLKFCLMVHLLIRIKLISCFSRIGISSSSRLLLNRIQQSSYRCNIRKNATLQRDNICTDSVNVIQNKLKHVKIILDLGYPWPNEKRPAIERQRAIIKQLSNYVDKIKEHSLKKPSLFNCSSFIPPSPPFLLCCGQGVTKLENKLSLFSPYIYHTNIELNDIILMDTNRNYLYLSPDAIDQLNVSSGWPTSNNFNKMDEEGEIERHKKDDNKDVVLIVGGIIDRNVKVGRSLKRALSLSQNIESNIESKQLPLSFRHYFDPELTHVVFPPLNIDTTLSLLTYWYVLLHQQLKKEEERQIKDVSSTNPNAAGLFRLASKQAFKEQMIRHPKWLHQYHSTLKDLIF